MKKFAQGALVAAAAAVLSTAASAATVIYSESFDSVAYGLNKTAFVGWTSTQGTVDVIGPGFSPRKNDGPTSHYVDLDGSSQDAGVLSYTLTGLEAGKSYGLTFDLAGGNHKAIDGSDTVDIVFGTGGVTLADIAWNKGWSTYTINGAADANGNLTISFANRGGDNVGALLDNVVVAVPEPESTALMLAGLGAMVLLRRRRMN